MKNMTKLIALLLLLATLVGSMFGCGDDSSTTGGNSNTPGNTPGGSTGGGSTGDKDDPKEFIDYAATVKLDMNSDRLRTEATVRTEVRDGETIYIGCIDGDTTHFNVPESVVPGGILKARYLGINTPESTGQVEPWGKFASNYNSERLKKATSIILESNDNKWNIDSTGERRLVWVWYKTAEMDDYRCLNLEILQAGLAWGSGYTTTIYEDACRNMLQQALVHKLYIHDKTKLDPNYCYGDAQNLTLKELKLNFEKYKDIKVSFEGVVARSFNNTVYIEEKDPETGEYFGIQVFCGYGIDDYGWEVLSVGNRVLMVGTVQYYQGGDYYQISGVYYDVWAQDDPDNFKLVSTGNTVAYDETTVPELLNGKLDITVTTVDDNGTPDNTDDDIETSEVKEFDYGFITLHSTKTLTNLTIKSVYTTNNGGDNDGAHSITCEDTNGNRIVIRTEVLLDSNRNKIPASYFPVGAKIECVKGIVDYYNGTYQLALMHQDDIVIVK